jgi:hypothetical protein
MSILMLRSRKQEEEERHKAKLLQEGISKNVPYMLIVLLVSRRIEQMNNITSILRRRQCTCSS